jgi:hypothetical protein
MKKLIPITLLIFITSCATISPESAKVKIVSPSELKSLSDCSMKSPIFESSEFGQEQLIIQLKNKTMSEGGNVLLSNMKTERSFGWLNPTDKTSGVVYNCPNETLAKLNDFGH